MIFCPDCLILQPGGERGVRLSRIYIEGPVRLEGRVSIQGSKNAVLPLMAAALLHKGVSVLSNVPMIQDVDCMASILAWMGCRIRRRGSIMEIDASTLRGTKIPDDYMKQMRSSVILLGALLGRTGEGECSYPGGCLIGSRPIDIHLHVLRALGAVLQDQDGRIRAQAPGGLRGSSISLRCPSVGATQQAVLGAVLAHGNTLVEGAAREPEVVCLCRFLNSMGARIQGAGSSRIRIEGVEALNGACFQVPGDRIVAGTYLGAVMSAGGKVLLEGAAPGELQVPMELMMRSGARIQTEPSAGKIWISMKERPGGLRLATSPYPGFPTDLQSVFMAFLASARGTSIIEEKIFEGRFGTAKELERMGADIEIQGERALIRGRWPLSGALVRAGDLRGGAALIAAGLGAAGETVVEDSGHIRRGYEDICRDLSALGARIHQK